MSVRLCLMIAVGRFWMLMPSVMHNVEWHGPFGVVFTEWAELPRASEMLSSMSNIYYVSIAAIVAAYYGFTNMGKKE